MYKLKPIETTYNGYKFRSRLEARWAVFFDVLGIKYEYEPEGYETLHGYYLPDFWLPETETYIEIKPLKYNEKREIEWPEDPRWDYIAEYYRLIVLCGTPGPVSDWINNSYMGFLFDEYSRDCYYYWTECPFCGCIDIQFEGRSARNRNHASDCLVKNTNNDKNYNYDSNRLLNAYIKARQARFEK